MMAVQEDQSGDHARLAKGKRTKRQRLASPIAAVAASTSSISGDGGKSPEAREGRKPKEMIIKGKVDNNQETTVVSRSISLTGDDDVACDLEKQRATKEDEDMANCLMLLKQGHKSRDQTRKPGFLSNKKPPPPSPSSLGLGLDGAYQCKTCEKSFSSFQALGGHRASHKKPRNVPTNNSEIFNDVQEKKSQFLSDEKQESERRLVINSSFLSLQVTNSSSSSSYVHHNIKKPDRTHECSICKAEFSSGQALGGHMRRHRNANATAAATATLDNVGNSDDVTTTSDHRSCQESKRQRNFPELDLNLPAPEEDRNYDKPRFPIPSKDQILVFAAAAASS